MNEAVSYEGEDRRGAYRAGVGPERELAVIRKGRREFTVWIRDVSSGGIGFASDGGAFRKDDKIVVVTSSGTFEGRVAHVTPTEKGTNLVGVQRLRILEELHAQILERGDLPRTPAWIGSLVWWTAASVAICAGLFYLESFGILERFGFPSSRAASPVLDAAASFDARIVAQRFRSIDSLLDEEERRRIGLSARQERHVVAIAEQTAIRLASILVAPPEASRSWDLSAGEAAITDAERRIEELLDADQRERWQASYSRVAGR